MENKKITPVVKKIAITAVVVLCLLGVFGVTIAEYTGGGYDGYGSLASVDLALGGPNVTISSAGQQHFAIGSPAAAISPITITDSTGGAITALNDIRIRIPAGFNMEWEITDTACVIAGTAASKVASAVTYEGVNKVLALNVTSNFIAGEYITVSGLSFTNFSAASSVNYLGLDIYNVNDTFAVDNKAISISAAADFRYSGGSYDGYNALSSSGVVLSSLNGDYFNVTHPTYQALTGVSQEITITARDAADNTIITYIPASSVSVAKTESGSVPGSAALGVISSFSSGIATVTLTDTEAENVAVTATDQTYTSMTGTSAPVTFKTIDHYAVSATSPQTAGAGWSETVTAKDAFGNTVTTDPGTVVTLSSNKILLSNAGGGTWLYRKSIPITGSAGAGIGYQVKILVGESSGTTGTNVNVDSHSTATSGIFNDVRFTTYSTGTTLGELSHWQESVTTTPIGNRIATYWVKVTADLGSAQSIYIYYGNSSAANSSADPAVQINTEINGGTKTVTQIALEIMGLPPAYAAAVFNSANLTVANAALIFDNANLSVANAALIFDNANLATARANSIITHANLTSNREQAILYQMVTNGAITKLTDIITLNSPNVTYSANSTITGTNIYRNLTVNNGITLTVNTSTSLKSSVIIAYSITNNGTILRSVQGGSGGIHNHTGVKADMIGGSANIYRIGSNAIGIGGNGDNAARDYSGGAGGAGGIGGEAAAGWFGGDGGSVAYTTKTAAELSDMTLNALIDYFIRTVQSKSSPASVQEFIDVYGAGGGATSSAQSPPDGGIGGGGLVVISKTIDNNSLISADGSTQSGGTQWAGAGGGSGGEIIIVANDYDNAGGTIRANGGVGGNSTYAYAGTGGGGGGGVIYVLYKTQTAAGTLTVNGEAAGIGGNTAAANAGGAGVAVSVALTPPGSSSEPSVDVPGAETLQVAGASSAKFYTSLANANSDTGGLATLPYTLSSGVVPIYVRDNKVEIISLTATDANTKTGTSGWIAVGVAPANKIVFTSSTQTLSTWTASAAYTVQVQDVYNNLRTADALVLNLVSTSGTGIFSTTSAFTSTVTSITTSGGVGTGVVGCTGVMGPMLTLPSSTPLP